MYSMVKNLDKNTIKNMFYKLCGTLNSEVVKTCSLNNFKSTLKNRKYCLSSNKMKINCNRCEKYFHCTALAFSFAKIYEFVGIKEEDEEVKRLLEKAKQLLEDGEVNKALEIYNNALKVADSLHNEEDIYFIKEQLAVIAFFSKKYEEAEQLFLEVKGYLMQKGLKVDDLKISYITLRLAEIYDNLRNSKKAEECYKICVDNLKARLSTESHHKDVEAVELWIMILTSKAYYYLNKDNYEEASRYLKYAYETCLQAKGEISEHTVSLLQQLGAVCFQKGDLEQAVEYLKKATDLGKHLPGMVELSNAYITLGNIYLRQGLIKDAEVVCTQGYKNAVRHNYEQGIKEADSCLNELKEAKSYS